VTLFDLIVLATIAISALLGYQRGAIRELVALFAFGIATAGTLFMLPFTSPFFTELLRQHLLGAIAAIVVGFAITYIAFRFLGGQLANNVHQTRLFGGADRVVGFALGVVRALVLIGLFALVFDRATPQNLKPDWITGAFTYPLASLSGRILGKVAPAGLRILGHPSALLKGDKQPDTDDTGRPDDAPAERQSTRHDASPLHKGRGKGYDQRSREQLNQLLERTQ
jgi:membrane protein required for colicin V production